MSLSYSSIPQKRPSGFWYPVCGRVGLIVGSIGSVLWIVLLNSWILVYSFDNRGRVGVIIGHGRLILGAMPAIPTDNVYPSQREIRWMNDPPEWWSRISPDDRGQFSMGKVSFGPPWLTPMRIHFCILPLWCISLGGYGMVCASLSWRFARCRH